MPINSNNQAFDNLQTDAFVELGVTLAKIHHRLLAEGYVIKDGQVVVPERKSDKV